jgi:hypothetical protein
MFKKSIRLIIVTVLIIILNVTNTYAHPGRTDKYGGHYVRTPG